PTERVQIAQSLPDAADNIAITDRDKNAVGHLPMIGRLNLLHQHLARGARYRRIQSLIYQSQLFADFQRARFFAFGGIWIVRRAATIPAKFFGRGKTELEGLVIAAAHEQDTRAVNQELRDLGGRRVFWDKDYRWEAGGGSNARERRARIPCARCRDNVRAEFARFGDDDSAGAVFERRSRIASIVLEIQILQS